MGSPFLTLDMLPEKTAVTSNPAAGVLTVDVKTFTGRGRVTYIGGTCLADANIASRNIVVYKVTSAGNIQLVSGPAFTAGTTGAINGLAGIGVGSWGINPASFPAIDFGPGDILRVTVASGQAGDDLSAITYSYKETPI